MSLREKGVSCRSLSTIHHNQILIHSPSPPTAPKQEPPYYTSGNRNTAYYSNTHQSLLGHLIVDQSPQIRRLHVHRLLVQQQIIVPPRLAVVAQLVVSQCQVVQTFATSLGRHAEDLGEE